MIPTNTRVSFDEYLSSPLDFPLEFKQWVDNKIGNGVSAAVPSMNDTAAGSTSIAAGSMSLSVTHGLGVPPQRVFLSPTADTQGLRWWVSAKGATTFTVTLSSTATSSPVTFDWKAEF